MGRRRTFPRLPWPRLWRHIHVQPLRESSAVSKTEKSKRQTCIWCEHLLNPAPWRVYKLDLDFLLCWSNSQDRKTLQFSQESYHLDPRFPCENPTVQDAEISGLAVFSLLEVVGEGRGVWVLKNDSCSLKVTPQEGEWGFLCCQSCFSYLR